VTQENWNSHIINDTSYQWNVVWGMKVVWRMKWLSAGVWYFFFLTWNWYTLLKLLHRNHIGYWTLADTIDYRTIRLSQYRSSTSNKATTQCRERPWLFVFLCASFLFLLWSSVLVAHQVVQPQRVPAPVGMLPSSARAIHAPTHTYISQTGITINYDFRFSFSKPTIPELFHTWLGWELLHH